MSLKTAFILFVASWSIIFPIMAIVIYFWSLHDTFIEKIPMEIGSGTAILWVYITNFIVIITFILMLFYALPSGIFKIDENFYFNGNMTRFLLVLSVLTLWLEIAFCSSITFLVYCLEKIIKNQFLLSLLILLISLLEFLIGFLILYKQKFICDYYYSF